MSQWWKTYLSYLYWQSSIAKWSMINDIRGKQVVITSYPHFTLEWQMNKHRTVKLICDNYQTVANDHLSMYKLLPIAYCKPQYYQRYIRASIIYTRFLTWIFEYFSRLQSFFKKMKRLMKLNLHFTSILFTNLIFPCYNIKWTVFNFSV